MTEPREVEAKFEATEQALEQLLSMTRFGDFEVHAEQPKQQDDLYYDTADGRLRQAGSSLRVRRKADSAVMTFKGARQQVGDNSNTVSRLEDEASVSLDQISSPSVTRSLTIDPEPSPLTRARRLADGQELIPIARLVTTRTVVSASSPAGVELELAVDRCTAERLSDGRKVQFVEVEAELKRGEVDDLLAATARLRQEIPELRPSTQTKLRRALN